MFAFRCVLPLILLLCVSTTAEAQVIRGRLLDVRTDDPIVGGAVTLRTRIFSVRTVVTDTAGRFFLRIPKPDVYLLEGSGLGYQNVKSAFLEVIGQDTIDVELRLATNAVPLAPLTVIARRNTNARLLEDFLHRKNTGFGQFIGPEDIARMVPFRATDLLRDLSGVRLVGDRSQTTLLMRAIATGYCQPNLVVDGVAAPEGVPINEWVSASSIRAIEVYSRAAEVPGQFASIVKKDCGAVVVWTESSLGR